MGRPAAAGLLAQPRAGQASLLRLSLAS
jgi:hypothetical protein